MTIRLLGRRAAPHAFASGMTRRYSRRDDIAIADPLVAPADSLPVLEETAVSEVVPVEPAPKTYRATVVRTVTQTAVVEFVADEGTDTHSMAQSLLETIPPESWVTQPADSWGYIDNLEEIGDAAPLAETPATLSRRYRGKAASGQWAAYDDQAILGVGYDPASAINDAQIYLGQDASEDETAESMGDLQTAEMTQALADLVSSSGGNVAFHELSNGLLGTWDDYNAQYEQLDDELPDEESEDLPPETLSRRGRRSRRSRRYARKAAYDVTVDGLYYATYDAETADDALAAYIAELGFATVDEAAAAAGLTVEEYLAGILVTEASPDDDAYDIELEAIV